MPPAVSLPPPPNLAQIVPIPEGPLREIFGVHHMKVHVFDNHVMMTGANLSEDYFTDRQDRCIVIQDCQALADYFDDLINLVQDVSY